MKLLEQVRQKIRLLNYSSKTAKTYCGWIEQFIRFGRIGGKWRHPSEMNERDVERWLTHLAVDRHLSANSQNQAFQSVLFLYKQIGAVSGWRKPPPNERSERW